MLSRQIGWCVASATIVACGGGSSPAQPGQPGRDGGHALSDAASSDPDAKASHDARPVTDAAHQPDARGSLPDTGGSVEAATHDAAAPDAGDAAWRPFNATSPWNTPIAASATVDPSSAALITDFSTIAGQTTLYVNIQQYSVPVYWVDSSTPSVTVTSSVGGTGFRTGATSSTAAAGTGLAPIPTGAMPAAGTDRHLSIVDIASHTEWGLWNANDGSSGWTAGEASTLDLSGSGVRPPTNDSPWWAGQGPRACGFGLIAGLITEDQIKSGVIAHALILAYPHIESRYYTSPASSAQGTTSEALPTRGIPCGGHIQLDPTLDVTTLGLSPTGLIIAHALQDYGAFIGDFSGAMSIYADESPTALAYWSSGVLSNGTVQAIPLDRFRVLTLGMTYDNNN